jgi:hypothetical protein
MTHATRALLKQALELPLDERASMAAELLDSLSEAEEGVEAAWASEIRNRSPQRAPARSRAQIGDSFSTALRRKSSVVAARGMLTSSEDP